MAFYAGQVIAHPAMKNPTLIVITDRNELDDQLFVTFAMCRDLLRQTPQQADSREDLQQVLTRPSGGVVFTTIQKFAPGRGGTDYPVLTDRRNVVVIADEVHRSQYGFRARVDRKTDEISYGFSRYLRDALPNASFIGFTGTPIEKEDVNISAVFGEYIDIYDINRGIEDGATVQIYYESRLARIELPEEEKPKIDAELTELTEDLGEGEEERFNREFGSVEAVVGSIVDYIGIAQNLRSALSQYSRDDQKQIGIDETQAVTAMLEKYEIVRDMFHGFDYRAGLTGSPQERLVALGEAIEWVLGMQQREAAREQTQEGKKRAHRRFNDAVLALPRHSPLLPLATRHRASVMRSGYFRPFGQRSPRPRAHLVQVGLPPSGTWPCSRSLAAPSSRPRSSIFSKPPGLRRPTYPSSPTSSSPRFKGWSRRISLWKHCAS